MSAITEKVARELTTALLQQTGWTVERVDTRHAFNPNIAVDFLGVADLLAMAPGRGLMLVQLTADSHPKAKRSHFLDRKRKVLTSDKAKRWVESGGRFMVIGWRPGPECEHVELTLKDFEE